MKVLSKYLFKTILHTSLLVFFVFLGLELFVFLMAELIDLKEGYGLREILIFVMSGLPSKLYLSMPIILLLGSLMGLARLAVSSELVVMLTSGVSKLQIIRRVLMAAGTLLVIAVMMGEWLGPIGDRFGFEHKSRTFKGRSFQPLSEIWVKSGNDFMFINFLSQDNKSALGVVRFQFDQNHSLKSASYAFSGHFEPTVWHMQWIQVTSFLKDGSSQSSFAVQEDWPVSVNLKILNHRSSFGYQESLWNLYRSIEYRKTHDLNVAQDEFLFWQRIWLPFATLIMICIGAPFIFGSLRERGIGSKLMIGVLIALVFYTLNAFFAPLASIFKLPPLLAVITPSLLLVFGVMAYLIFSGQIFSTLRYKGVK